VHLVLELSEALLSSAALDLDVIVKEDVGNVEVVVARLVVRLERDSPIFKKYSQLKNPFFLLMSSCQLLS
jgi:hypothetical protein